MLIYDYYTDNGLIRDYAIDKVAKKQKTDTVTIWENDEISFKNSDVAGLEFTIDTENATTGTTERGTDYIVLNLSNIIGGELTKANIPASNPLTFTATGLALCGLVGLAFKLASGLITGGSLRQVQRFRNHRQHE